MVSLGRALIANSSVSNQALLTTVKKTTATSHLTPKTLAVPKHGEGPLQYVNPTSRLFIRASKVNLQTTTWPLTQTCLNNTKYQLVIKENRLKIAKHKLSVVSHPQTGEGTCLTLMFQVWLPV